MIALLLTAVVAAQPVNRDDWVTFYDYPKRALRQQQAGTSTFHLTVGTTGKPIRCELSLSSGHVDLDNLACALLMKRARFKPAAGLDGLATLAVFNGNVRWQIPGMTQAPPNVGPSDVMLTVARLPDGVDDPASIEVGLLVGADGRILECTPTPADYSEKRNARRLATVATLWKTACAQASLSYRAKPALDENDRPVVSVQTIRVSFATNGTSRR